MKSLEYRGGLSAWPIPLIQKLSKVITNMVGHAVQLPRTYPHKLIHATTGGLGYPSRMDNIATMRYATITRCLHGPGPAAWAAHGIHHRAFLSAEAATNDQAPTNTMLSSLPPHHHVYMATILQYGREAGVRLAYTGHLDSPIHTTNMPQLDRQLQDNLATLDVQYLEDLRGADGTMVPWLRPPIGSKRTCNALSRMIDDLSRPHDIPYHICKGHVLVIDHPSGRHFFLVEGIHVDTNIGLKGIAYWPMAQEDNQLGFLVQPVNSTRQRYGCAHGDTLAWSYVEQWCVGLAFGIDQRDIDDNPQYRILGLNLAATLIRTPRVSNPWGNTAPWCQDLTTYLALHPFRPTYVTFMTNRTRCPVQISQIWDETTHYWNSQGILLLWGPQNTHDPTLYLLLGIRLLQIPPEYSDTPLATAIFMTLVAYQVAQTLEITKVESPDYGVLKHIHREARIGEDRSHETKPYAHILRHLRHISQICHISHSCPRWPKPLDTTPGYTNLYEDRHQILQTLVLMKEEELLQSRSAALVPRWWTLRGRDVLQQAISPDTYYWVNHTDHTPVMRGLQRPTHQLLSSYLHDRDHKWHGHKRWSTCQLGLLAFVWPSITSATDKLDYMRTLWDQRSNGRNNAKSGLLPYIPCILCNQGSDSQYHILLQCSHPWIQWHRSQHFQYLNHLINTAAINPTIAQYCRHMISMVTDPTGDAPQQLSWFLGYPHRNDTDQLPNPTIDSKEVPLVLKLFSQMWLAAMTYAKESDRLRWNLLSMPRDISNDITQMPPSPTAIQELLSIRFVTHQRRIEPHRLTQHGFTRRPPRTIATPVTHPMHRPRAPELGPLNTITNYFQGTAHTCQSAATEYRQGLNADAPRI